MKKLVFLFLLVAASGLMAQEKVKAPDPVHWSYSYEQSPENADELIVFLKASIDPNWHIYSQQAANDGPIPTTFSFTKDSVRFVLVGAVNEPAGEAKMDEAFGVQVKSFAGTVVFTQKIKRLSKTPFTITGSLEFMCCNNAQCLPPRTVAFTLDVK